MKKIIYALILAVFCLGCFSAWGMLTTVQELREHFLQGRVLPEFTNFCLRFRPLLLALPILPAAYCLWVWSRKKDQIPSWTGFFAATTCALLVVALPTIFVSHASCLETMEVLLSK